MSAPDSSGAYARLRGDLDAVAERNGEAMSAARARTVYGVSLAQALPLLAAIPGLYALAELGAWTKNEPAHGLSIVIVASIAAALPFAWAAIKSRSVRREGTDRSVALGAVDERLDFEGRLLAADQFTAKEAPTSFEMAAIEDATSRTSQALASHLDFESTVTESQRSAMAWGAAGAVFLGLSLWFASWERHPAAEGMPTQEIAAAGAGAPAAPEEPRRDGAPERPDQDVPPPAAAADRKPAPAAASKPTDVSPEVSEEAKESSGKTGAGRSSGAMSSSAASESKSSPSTQGQPTDPSKESKKPKPADKKKPKDTGADPKPEESPENEQSGATAGKGSSKGSNKNPTASDWKSRDQVTDADDQEVEDDEETDEDEEEQENRGGVQPSLRDRRPPVSRDLQIGFGNRPNPDANGRGGPSEQKKSRGVASLVLGVPIPDRIKGRPGPGPTKITQERIEPDAEESSQITAAARKARSTPLKRPSSLQLDASLRKLVQGYFLKRRANP